jgi:hypothetical protein
LFVILNLKRQVRKSTCLVFPLSFILFKSGFGELGVHHILIALFALVVVVAPGIGRGR